MAGSLRLDAMIDWLGLFHSFLPFENPIGFGAADFLELALAAWLAAMFLLRPVAEPWLRRLALRPVVCFLLLAVAPVSLRLALLPHHPVPRAETTEEFAILRTADNLRHFHWLNPAHPMAAFFGPAYAVAQPPGIAIPTALGQAAGEPWAGMVVSVAALCAACYWMLQAWTTPGWALTGGALAVCAFGPLNGWMNDFCGGAISALSGCLVLGALPRLAHKPRWWLAAILAAGLVLAVLTQHIAIVAPIVLLLCVLALQFLGRRSSGHEVAMLLVSFFFFRFCLWYGAHLLEVRGGAAGIRQYEARNGIDRPDPERRAVIDRLLSEAPGRQLVFIRYWPGHQRWDEWIYNDSDIDAARVVRARDLGPAENERLRAYYPDRTAWLLEPDAKPPKLSPYQPEPQPQPVAKPPEPAQAKPAATKPLLQFEEVPQAR